MQTPQSSIFKDNSNHFTFIEFKLNEDVSAAQFKTAYQNIKHIDEVETVVSFNTKTCSLLAINHPKDFVDFKSLKGDKEFGMPSTQRDLFLWIHSNNESLNFDKARTIIESLSTISKCEINQTAFIYHDKRDLMGFVDGSANPKEDKRIDAAINKEFGGSIVFSQKWSHQLQKFDQVPVKEQEQIIGRTKQDSIELEGDEMPNNSHVSRTDAKVDGVAMKIYRRSAPFINGNEHGLFFLAFACHTERVDVQLQRMLGITEDKIVDRIMEFSKPITGSYWYAPSEEALAKALN